MAKTYQAPWFVRVGNVLSTTLLRAGVTARELSTGEAALVLRADIKRNPFARYFGVTADSSLEEFERAALSHPLFALEGK